MDGDPVKKIIWVMAVLLIIIGMNSFISAQQPPAQSGERIRPVLRDSRIVNSSIDVDGNRISDSLDMKINENLTSHQINNSAFIEVLIGLDHPPDQNDIQIITDFGGRVIKTWADVVYSIHASLPIDMIKQYALEDSVVLIEENAEISICLDESVRQIQVRPRVWDTYGYLGNSDHAVAVFDTGIDNSHPDLAGKLVKWKDFSSEAFSSAVDYGEHGTHCAGIIAGTGSASSISTKKFTTSFSDYSYFRFDVDVFSHRTYVVMNVSRTLTVKLDWDDDLEDDGYGTASIWIDTDQDEIRESGEYSSSGRPFTFSKNVDAGRYLVAVAAHDYDSWQEDFFCQITVSTDALDDGHNLLCGVAPNMKLAGIKVLNSNGAGSVDDIIDGINWLSQNAESYGIIAASLSLGLNNGEINANLDTAVNNLVSSGVVCVIAGGNTQGTYYVPSPGAAAKALTVGAVNDVDALTEYSSIGNPLLYPIKPDVLAPGGSWQTGDEIISVDSNDADKTFEFDDDKYADDYRQNLGTSMACPHVAGIAGLVAEALGPWNYSESHAFKVKQLILMTCVEVGSAETGGFTPSFDHGGKDNKEGFGRVCADAAVEAACMVFDGVDDQILLGEGRFDKKVWARMLPVKVNLTYNISLDVPGFADYDLYLYDETPDSYGEPVLLNASYNPLNQSESIIRSATSNKIWYMVVKWRSGSGNATVDVSRDLPCSFDYTPLSPTTQDTIVFNDTSDDDEIIGWYWDFDDENVSTQEHPTHMYSDNGSYQVNLTITGPYNITNSTSIEITVANVAPSGNFSYQPRYPNTRDNLDFTDTSFDLDGNVTSWFWDFGDGTNSSLQHPMHSFDDNGSYVVVLNVTDDDGAWNLTSQNISVNNTSPIISFNFSPRFPEVGDIVTFNATINDTDGSIQNITWMLNGTARYFIENFTHTFTMFESVWVNLSVIDDDNAISNCSTWLVMKNMSVNLTGQINQTIINQTDCHNMQISLNTSNQTMVSISRFSSDPFEQDLSNLTGLNVFYDVNMENNSRIVWPMLIKVFYHEDDLTVLGVNESQLMGLYYFDSNSSQWTLFNQTGKNITSQMGYDGFLWAETWHLTNITAFADTVIPGNITNLEVSNDHDGKLGLSWDEVIDNSGVSFYQVFVDGNFSENTTGNVTSHQIKGLTNGITYSVMVRAVDLVGNIGYLSNPVNGTPTKRPRASTSSTSSGPVMMAPVVYENPIADPGGPYDGVAEIPVGFDASESSDPDGSIASVIWDFGDGESSEGLFVNHTFKGVGNFTVKVQVIDEHGLVSENVTYVVIGNIQPDIPVINGSKIGTTGENVSFQILCVDENHDLLSLFVDWGDGNSSMIPSYTTGLWENVSYQWVKAGLYEVEVFATDPVNETSPAINFSVLVGGIFCNQSGYLLDVDDDGIFDRYIDNQTGNMTMVVFKDDDYLLDLDGDGKLDHMVDAKSGLSTYEKEIDVDTPGFEMILLIGTILCLLFFMKKKMR